MRARGAQPSTHLMVRVRSDFGRPVGDASLEVAGERRLIVLSVGWVRPHAPRAWSRRCRAATERLSRECLCPARLTPNPDSTRARDNPRVRIRSAPGHRGQHVREPGPKGASLDGACAWPVYRKDTRWAGGGACYMLIDASASMI